MNSQLLIGMFFGAALFVGGGLYERYLVPPPPPQAVQAQAQYAYPVVVEDIPRRRDK